MAVCVHRRIPNHNTDKKYVKTQKLRVLTMERWHKHHIGDAAEVV